MNREENMDRNYLKDGKNESVMFVNSTLNERLKRKMERVAKKYKIKVKVAERGGRKMKRMLQKKWSIQEDRL